MKNIDGSLTVVSDESTNRALQNLLKIRAAEVRRTYQALGWRAAEEDRAERSPKGLGWQWAFGGALSPERPDSEHN